jgi:hypothetical protein
VVSGAVAVVGAVDVSVGWGASVSDGPRIASRTSDTTSAISAAATAAIAISACPVRYHGVGGGLKVQVFALNASKRSWSGCSWGNATVSSAPAPSHVVASHASSSHTMPLGSA